MDESGVQRRITAFWERVAPEYDRPENENVAVPGTPSYSSWTEALARVLSAATAWVLDVRTGTGFAAGIAAELGHQVVGLDASAQMVALASRRHSGVRFVEGDAVHPPLPPASFDVVLSRSLIWTLRELDTALANWCLRSLHPWDGWRRSTGSLPGRSQPPLPRTHPMLRGLETFFGSIEVDVEAELAQLGPTGYRLLREGDTLF